MANLNDLIVQGASRFVGDAQGSKFIVAGGTSSQFMKADGSLDSTTYATSGNLSGYVPTGRTVSAGTGLSGGGNLGSNQTLSLATTGTAGTYTSVNVDSYGRVTGGTNTQYAPKANYFIIGSTEGSANVPNWDAYTDTLWVTARSYTTAQKAQARTNIDAASVSEVNLKEDKVAITTTSSASLTAEVGKYYRYDSAVGTLAITLPVPSDTTYLSNIIFAFTTDTTTNVTFSSTATIKKQDGFEIEASSSYEVNAIYNGSYWALAAIKFGDE